MTKSTPFRLVTPLPLMLICLQNSLAPNAFLRARQCRHPFPHAVKRLAQLVSLLTLMSWQLPGHARGLQTEEQDVAAALASQVPWAETAGKRVSHPLGVQTLFIEKQENKDASDARQARVYQYDYTTQAARMLVIDLENRSVNREQHIDSVHLPLNQQEIIFARSLLAQDDSLLAQLREEQSLRNVTPFVSLDELDVKASIYEPLDSNDPCFVARCALLSLFDATRTVFTTEPLIYLNDQQTGELHRR